MDIGTIIYVPLTLPSPTRGEGVERECPFQQGGQSEFFDNFYAFGLYRQVVH